MRTTWRDRGVRIAASAGLLGAVLSAAGAAAAATANVPCSPSVPGGGPAGLIAAVNKANARGGGTVDLAQKCTYTLGPKPDNDHNGLPIVRTPITIEGNGSTVARSQAPNTDDFRIIEVDGPGRLTINSLAVTGGRSSGGGGIVDDNGAALTVDNSRVHHNTVTNPLLGAKAFGGGIFVDHDSRLTLANSRVDHNSVRDAPLAGAGGVYENNGSTATISTSRVDHNSVDATMIAVGGGIALDGGSGSRTVAVRNSRLDGNVVEATGSGADNLARGGGVENNGTAVTLTSSRVIDNKVDAGHGSAFGGGIHNLTSRDLAPTPDGHLALTSSQVSRNTTSGGLAGGGGISNQVGQARITSSVVTGNAAVAGAGGADGGGIENVLLSPKLPLTPLTMTTTVLRDNAATASGLPGQPACGGGLFNSGTAAVNTSAITGNRANASPARGGGVFNALTPLKLALSVVAGNVPDNRVDGTTASCNRP